MVRHVEYQCSTCGHVYEEHIEQVGPHQEIKCRASKCSGVMQPLGVLPSESDGEQHAPQPSDCSQRRAPKGHVVDPDTGKTYSRKDTMKRAADKREVREIMTKNAALDMEIKKLRYDCECKARCAAVVVAVSISVSISASTSTSTSASTMCSMCGSICIEWRMQT